MATANKINGTLLGDGRSYIASTIEATVIPDKPEPSQADYDRAKRADRLPQDDLLAERRWTPDQLGIAQARYGFPKGQLFFTAGWRPRPVVYFSKRVIAEWEAGRHELGL
jgi:hypothetical protein